MGVGHALLPRCPYPLAENIEPCICQVDDHLRMRLTCVVQHHIDREDFDRIVDAFDYDNNIYSVDIDLAEDSYHPNNDFNVELTKDNLGKLNITTFSIRNAHITRNVFQAGAFDGSSGSLRNITMDGTRTTGNGTVDLSTHVLHPACATLEVL